MASVFTYETDPVKVASPWPEAPTERPRHASEAGQSALAVPPTELLADYRINKLVAEPQEGPVEYKLHLLLRPRRSFSATSTVQRISGSHLSKSRGPSTGFVPGTPSRSGSSTPVLAPSNVSKQNRLQHLTTQLLWRLQQSSPHHTSSKSDLILPVLPDAEVQTSVANGPGKLISGLEESLGALYEIGVSDDGSFVGLTREELDESLMVLRAMSYSLGCRIQLVRMVDVGNCQWDEDVEAPDDKPPRIREEKLWVAEVLVGPNVGLPNRAFSNGSSMKTDYSSGPRATNAASSDGKSHILDGQFRISLTGSTTSGKSSLLGTLSTSTLDNGRGKSRLSLLKHRHEIVSGITSSLAQELIGYQDVGVDGGSTYVSTQVVNYASANVSSWNDIHNIAHPGRLIFVTDSAGHPRYRRTTVRGLISWAPHWTLCCVAADDNEDNTGKTGATASAGEILGPSGQGIDLSRAHLDHCLKLGLPLMVVITKYDLASKTGLRPTLIKVLSTLKDAGRKPEILPVDAGEGGHVLSQQVSKAAREAVQKVISSMSQSELHLLVPIVLTSVVSGVGISQIHSLLRQLPILASSVPTAPRGLQDTSPLFHIDEVFQHNGSKSNSNFILSGYLRYGTLAVGDYTLIGPFTADAHTDTSEDSDTQHASSYPGPRRGLPKSPRLSSIRHRASSENLKGLIGSSQIASDESSAWHRVAITSIRNLRLPVRKLHVGQVATIAITLSGPTSHKENDLSRDALILRRGMVLLPCLLNDGGTPLAYSTITANFKEPNTYVIPGSLVTVYIASIRALAKIIEVRVPDGEAAGDEVFTFDDEDETASTLARSVSSAASEPRIQAIEITFKFSSSREWVELGTQVFVTPASGLSMLNPLERGDVGGAGLDGFVGNVVSAAM